MFFVLNFLLHLSLSLSLSRPFCFINISSIFLSPFSVGIQEKLGFLNNGTVYALYDYQSQNEDELSFKEGDELKVLRKDDANEKEWWWSKDHNHQEGYIPRNLIGGEMYSK
ncbi:SH3 domain containing protein 2 [Sarcoptes scabiei]|uniref:SH3 domain containing protein 2 n=1 Tax=Sarcoptes scabiei TaxID=52283 RepID=A0A132A7Z8_SARSC|nr:SH3 domain containing protein 2 [Sarcoptes scabiei]